MNWKQACKKAVNNLNTIEAIGTGATIPIRTGSHRTVEAMAPNTTVSVVMPTLSLTLGIMIMADITMEAVDGTDTSSQLTTTNLISRIGSHTPLHIIRKTTKVRILHAKNHGSITTRSTFQ